MVPGGGHDLVQVDFDPAEWSQLWCDDQRCVCPGKGAYEQLLRSCLASLLLEGLELIWP